MKNLYELKEEFERYYNGDYESFQIDQIKDVLNSLDESEVVSLYNEYLDPDDNYYNNDEEFFDMCYGCCHNVFELIRALQYGNYNMSQKYVYLDVYAHLYTCDYQEILDNATSDNDFIQWIIEGNADQVPEELETIVVLLRNEETFASSSYTKKETNKTGKVY